MAGILEPVGELVDEDPVMLGCQNSLLVPAAELHRVRIDGLVIDVA